MKRSGSSCTVHWQINNHQNKAKARRQQTTRKSPSQICVSPREATAKQQKKRVRAQHKQKITHDLPQDTGGVSHMSQKHAETETNCVHPSLTKQTKVRQKSTQIVQV